jgi:cupin fold WbuC family metalloprotein
MKGTQIVDKAMLDKLVAEASESPRRRKNLNFHDQNEYPCHRLLNAMQPDSYIQPHCHAAETKDESIVVLRGRLGLVIYDPKGEIVEKAILEPGGAAVAADIPHGTFHGWVCLEPGSVFFESKAGPYEPLQPHEKAAWAPAEGEAGAAEYLEEMRALFE